MAPANEHSATVTGRQFDQTRRHNRVVEVDGGSKTIGLIFGVKSGGKIALAAMRFPRSQWTPKQAREYGAGHGAISFVAAKRVTVAADESVFFAQPDDAGLELKS